MKTPVSYNGKFNSIYSELRQHLALSYSEFQILKTTKVLLDAHTEDHRRDSLILKDQGSCSELDFSDSYYTDRDFMSFNNDLSILENHSIDGTFVPTSYILKSIENPDHGLGL